MRNYLLLWASLPFLTAFSNPSLTEKITDAAHRSSLDPQLVEAIVHVESGFQTHATSAKGAKGLMQVMPRTADQCEIHDAYHAVNNLMGACDCLRTLINRYRGNLKLALAAYNAGPRNVDHYQGVPPFPETKAYVKRVLDIYRHLKMSRLASLHERDAGDAISLGN